MTHFGKKRDCPSSFELADLVAGEFDGVNGLRIASHLGSCDFCVAELEFYSHYPPGEAIEPTRPMPGPLRELAEALLARNTIHISRLKYLLEDLSDAVLRKTPGQTS